MTTLHQMVINWELYLNAQSHIMNGGGSVTKQELPFRKGSALQSVHLDRYSWNIIYKFGKCRINFMHPHGLGKNNFNHCKKTINIGLIEVSNWTKHLQILSLKSKRKYYYCFTYQFVIRNMKQYTHFQIIHYILKTLGCVAPGSYL